MADRISSQKRSENMSRITGKNNEPEKYIRKLLFRQGYRYRLYSKEIVGHPDLWLKKYNCVIFVNGCFWHRHSGCKFAYIPKTRTDFWQAKFMANVARDNAVKESLMNDNIRCLYIWECTIKEMKKSETKEALVLADIVSFLKADDAFREI